MKTTFLTVLLTAILMCGAVQASTFTLKLDNDYAAADLTKRFGAFDVGATVGVDYFLAGSSISGLDLDIRDWSVGPIVKYHFTKEDAKWDPYVGFAMMIPDGRLANLQLKDVPLVYEGGVNFYFSEHVGVGLLYQYCSKAKKEDRVMLSLPVRF